MNRRDLLKTASAFTALQLAGCATGTAPPVTRGRVVIIGGGFGGATAAKYLSLWSGRGLEIYLVDRNHQFVSCPLSNLVLGGSRRMEDITRGYEGLRERGIRLMGDEVTAIDTQKKVVKFGQRFADINYDRLIIAPGIDFMFDAIQGLDAEAQKTVLHAWKAGPDTVALRRQLEAMPDGGTYVLSIPRAPYRCPPGPYERACQVASYFKQAKPRSKVLILDANEDVTSKAGLFKAAWKDLYPGIVEYRPNSEVKSVDVKNMTVKTDFDTVKGHVLNVLPPMRAADIARKTGLVTANDRWCGVDWLSMESLAQPGIHVLGDATLSAPAMPKSGHMANQHGKLAAAAIIELMNGHQPEVPANIINSCYSFVSAREAIHVSSVHRYDAAQKTLVTVPGSGGLSSARNDIEGLYALAWAQNIWRDMLD